MPKAIISDASCFILFQKIDSLDLLAATYGTVFTTPTVAAEVRFTLPDWVDVSLGLDVTGSVGVILRAKSMGLISAIRPFILAIRTTSFRLSPDIEKQAFLLAGEDDQ